MAETMTTRWAPAARTEGRVRRLKPLKKRRKKEKKKEKKKRKRKVDVKRRGEMVINLIVNVLFAKICVKVKKVVI